MTISSPDLISRCGFAGCPFTSTLPALQAFCASERGPEQARDVEPDVQADRVHLSILSDRSHGFGPCAEGPHSVSSRRYTDVTRTLHDVIPEGI